MVIITINHNHRFIIENNNELGLYNEIIELKKSISCLQYNLDTYKKYINDTIKIISGDLEEVMKDQYSMESDEAPENNN